MVASVSVLAFCLKGAPDLAARRPLADALGGPVRAATDPPLPPALESPVVRVFRRVALAVAGDLGDAAQAARREVRQALQDTGHEVIILDGTPISLPPARDLLVAISKRYDASALVVVRTSADDPTAISISLYNLGGSRLFDFSGRILAPVTPIASHGSSRRLDPRVLPLLDGPEFYRRAGLHPNRSAKPRPKARPALRDTGVADALDQSHSLPGRRHHRHGRSVLIAVSRHALRSPIPKARNRLLPFGDNVDIVRN